MRVEIPEEGRRVLKWWRSNRLESGEAGQEYFELCEAGHHIITFR